MGITLIQLLLKQKVGSSYAYTAGFIGVRRTNPAPGGTDLVRAQRFFGKTVPAFMERKNQMTASAESQPFTHVYTLFFKRFDLLAQR